MTKISKKSAYPVKTPVVKDYFVGTDSENNLKTVNYEFEGVAKLINTINGFSTIDYKFVTSENIPLDRLTEGNFLSINNTTLISDVTKLYINRFNHSNEDLYELFLYLKLNSADFHLKLQNSNNLNSTVYFNIIGIEDFTTYFEVNIKLFKSNPYLPSLINWNIYFFKFDLRQGAGSGGSGDYLPDGLISLNEPSQVGNAITINALDAVWRKNQLTVTNPNIYTTTINSATEGFYRIDVIQGFYDGTMSIVNGLENGEIAIKPDLDIGAVEILAVPVFGGTVLPIVTPEPIQDISTKLDKGGYTGTAQTLADEITNLKTVLYPLRSKFILVHKATENTNNTIELNDLAHGFGPGTGVDEEYWLLARYLNLTGDNNVHNYLNYKPISVTYPNS